MINRLFVLLIVSICVVGISFHFIVEGLGGVQDHTNGRPETGLVHSHDGDQFILVEAGVMRPAQPASHVFVLSDINQVSHPVPPPFHPPKSF
jgi:hypothetical protein